MSRESGKLVWRCLGQRWSSKEVNKELALVGAPIGNSFFSVMPLTQGWRDVKSRNRARTTCCSVSV